MENRTERKGGSAVRTLDRIILIVIAVGIWANVAAYLFKPIVASAIDSSDIDDFQSAVEGIVEDCRVRGYVSGDYMSSGRISC